MSANIAALSCYLPQREVTNEELQAENPAWEMAKVAAKTGINCRRIAAEGETAADLAFAAAERLFAGSSVQREEIDYLLFCTQSPDYVLPASACILQDRLRLPVSCGAIDFNQGCSGFIYGLQLANALVCSGSAFNVLLLTGETYSKYIHPGDRSVRVLFGDAATATVVSADKRGARIVATVVGTDGSGCGNLIVPIGGARRRFPAEPLSEYCDENGSVRSAANLFMDGQELFAFTMKRVPALIHKLLTKTGLTLDEIDSFVFHQANAFMNEQLRTKMRLPKEKVPLSLSDVGNTVSNTIPLTLSRIAVQLSPGNKVMLIGFGVGYSWGAGLLEWGDVEVSTGI
ncbi:MAG: ketoacyl-ACP synthase III [Terracidiphilus sp.]|jgi:3-oxoacyl-[acyl-carrier-protein] synthase-3